MDSDTLPGYARKTLASIVAHMIVHNGQAPTIRELCGMRGCASTSAMARHLGVLSDAGLIALDDRSKSRGITIPGAAWTPPANVTAILAEVAA